MDITERGTTKDSIQWSVKMSVTTDRSLPIRVDFEKFLETSFFVAMIKESMVKVFP